MPPRRTSLKDVAAKAGVSLGTVSNVLNRPELVRPEVQEKVKAAIQDLGYVQNAQAKALRTGSAPIVGVAVLELDNPFFMEAAAAIEQVTTANGCLLALSASHSQPKLEKQIVQMYAAQRVRGIIVTPTTNKNYSLFHTIQKQGIPLVLFDTADQPEGISTITSNDQLGAQLAVKHLIELGHRDIAFINGPTQIPQAAGRLIGAQAACEKAAGTRLTVYTGSELKIQTGRDFAAQIIAAGHTAVFCANDLIALGLIVRCYELGYDVPQHLSVVGYDDIAIAQQMRVPLTTIRQPLAQMGQQAAELLFKTDLSQQPNWLKFTPQLVLRNSTASR